jgi:hypothetical protein
VPFEYFDVKKYFDGRKIHGEKRGSISHQKLLPLLVKNVKR